MRELIFPWRHTIDGFGDMFVLTSVAKQTNMTIQIRESQRFGDARHIFENLAKVVFIPDSDMAEDCEGLFFEKYGITNGNPTSHYCVNWLKRLGLNEQDCLPTVKFSKLDIDWATHFLSFFKSPILFCPIPGGYRNPSDSNARLKMLPNDMWDKIIHHLKDKHDILYITAPNNWIPFDGTIPILGQSLRKICSLFAVAKQHLGIENGLLHAAIASGANVHAFLADSPNYNINNYCYTKEMFDYVNEPNRANYYRFVEIEKLCKMF